MVAAAVVIGVRPALPDGAITADQAAALRARLEQAETQQQALRGQLVTADAELAIERAARRALEDNLSALQVQAGQLRDRVAFYDQLLPAGPAGTVSIRAVEMTRVPAGLRYRVLLMRSARPGLPPFTGALHFMATGTLVGKDVRIPLAALQAAPDVPVAVAIDTPADSRRPGAETLEQPGIAAQAASAPITSLPASTPEPMAAGVPVQVDQYLSTEGMLALPEGFSPSSADVNVVQDGVVLATQQAAVSF
ncbi:hypothetical protein BAU07_22650 [Bordetella flabilis]|uniref:Uncharacterized protein n=1 Tax=Bordetella flabilis TaxID=463014 RepID=A0A193GM91_9BORD|nr:hypothetical protein BAU07_22650 [Bordetella flabilis]